MEATDLVPGTVFVMRGDFPRRPLIIIALTPKHGIRGGKIVHHLNSRGQLDWSSSQFIMDYAKVIVHGSV